MAGVGRMHLSIDLAKYYALPSDVRARFDGWMEAENLRERMVVKLALTEGAVVIDRAARDDEGRVVVQDGDVVWVTEVVPVRTMPPKEAFDV